MPSDETAVFIREQFSRLTAEMPGLPRVDGGRIAIILERLGSGIVLLFRENSFCANYVQI